MRAFASCPRIVAALGVVGVTMILVSCGTQPAAEAPTPTEAPAATAPPTTAPSSNTPPTTAAPTTAPPTTKASASADEVGAALQTAGLPVGKVRENTGFCKDAGCTKLITTDVVSAYEFGANTPAADKWATAFASSYEQWRSGNTVARFAEGGSTPAYDVAKVRVLLAGLGFVQVSQG
jgi:glucose/arabinose dehydrogenase